MLSKKSATSATLHDIPQFKAIFRLHLSVTLIFFGATLYKKKCYTLSKITIYVKKHTVINFQKWKKRS